MRSSTQFVALAVTLLIYVCAVPAFAVMYPLEIFTNNGPYSDGTDVDLFMDVSNVGNEEGYTDFMFYNNSIVDCSITNIYFDDGSLLGIDAIENGPIGVVLFDTAVGGPGNLPGGGAIGFSADKEFNIGPVSPPSENGVNNIPAGEWVNINFALEYIVSENRWATLDDVLNELNDGTLRVGIHIQAFPGGSSESAVNVPEPATIGLLGLGGLWLLHRKRRV